MVLEEHVIFVRTATDPAEDVAFHEFIDIGPKSIDDIMIIPDIDLIHLLSMSLFETGKQPFNRALP